MNHTRTLKTGRQSGWLFSTLFILNISILNFCAIVANAQSDDDLTVEYYSIPSPDELLSYIHNNEIEYTPRLLVDVTRNNQYNTFQERLVSYGFYMANMAYAISFEQTSTALKYFDLTDEMGKNMNLFPQEVEQIGMRLMRNMNNMDSINNLYDELYLVVIANLHDTDRFGEYALISAGGYIESLYLALNSNGSKIKEDDFKMRVWDQKLILDQLHKMFNKYLSPAVKTQVLKDFEGLTNAFNEYTTTLETATAAKRTDGAVMIGASTSNKAEINPIEKIHEQVNILRAKWVK